MGLLLSRPSPFVAQQYFMRPMLRRRCCIAVQGNRPCQPSPTPQCVSVTITLWLYRGLMFVCRLLFPSPSLAFGAALGFEEEVEPKRKSGKWQLLNYSQWNKVFFLLVQKSTGLEWMVDGESLWDSVKEVGKLDESRRREEEPSRISRDWLLQSLEVRTVSTVQIG